MLLKFFTLEEFCSHICSYPHFSNIVNFVGLIQGLSVINANLKEKLENDISIRHNSVKWVKTYNLSELIKWPCNVFRSLVGFAQI